MRTLISQLPLAGNAAWPVYLPSPACSILMTDSGVEAPGRRISTVTESADVAPPGLFVVMATMMSYPPFADFVTARFECQSKNMPPLGSCGRGGSRRTLLV